MFEKVKNLLRSGLGISGLLRVQQEIQRDIRASIAQRGLGGIDIRVDNTTPRLPILKKSSNPVIVPTGRSWKAGAVFDGRPIKWRGEDLIYFCAQQAYRTDAHLFVGLGELVNGEWRVADVPVIVPDIERRGIDIPSFTVHKDRIVGAYLDDYGPMRTGRGVDADLIVALSDDGRIFNKRVFGTPMRGMDFDRVGLPWLLNDDNNLRVYFRAKKDRKNLLVRSVLDLDHNVLVDIEIIGEFPRNPINIAVTRRNNRYLIFYGGTCGGGLYVANSEDGVTFDFSGELMLVSDDHEWGWDYYKVCGSPCNTSEDEMTICYLGGHPLSIGYATTKASLICTG